MQTIFAAAFVLALILGGGGGGREGAFIEGRLELDVVGPGAAPFGVASGILASSTIGLNLGRAMKGMGMAPPPAASELRINERANLTLDFVLKAVAPDHFVLEDLRVDWLYRDHTSIVSTKEKIRIVDDLRDLGHLTWREGTWSAGAPPDLPEPRIDLVFEGAPGTEDARYRLEVSVPHPVQPHGRSVWSSPMGQVSVIGRGDGTMVVKGKTPDFIEKLTKVSGGPSAELFDQMAPLIGEGFEIGPFGAELYERTFEGPRASLPIERTEVFINGAGASVSRYLKLGDFQAILDPIDPEWLPAPGATVTAHAYSVEGEAVRWRFVLEDVSREEGRCVNCPLREGEDPEGWDLRFAEGGSPGFGPPKEIEAGRFAIESREPMLQAWAKIEATDYGAFGKVRAEVLVDGEWFPVRARSRSGESITIPLDEAGGQNGIADAWERDEGILPGTHESTDDDPEPKAYHAGDGLSLYEEYRGFSVGGAWRRLDPKKKDVFVRVADGSGLSGMPTRELGWRTGLVVHEIERDEWDPRTRVVNFRRGFGSLTAQHALYLLEGPLGGGQGQACERLDCAPVLDSVREALRPKHDPHPDPYNGTPKTHAAIWVDRSAHSNAVSLGVTVAHELLHGLSVDHHGSEEAYVPSVCVLPDGRPRVMAERACLDLDPRTRWKRYYGAAAPHGAFAGDQACVMVYDHGGNRDAKTRWTRKPAGKITLDDIEPEPLRFPWGIDRVVCTSPAGTHFNAGGAQVAEASRGNCKDQVRVCDADH